MALFFLSEHILGVISAILVYRLESQESGFQKGTRVITFLIF